MVICCFFLFDFRTLGRSAQGSAELFLFFGTRDEEKEEEEEEEEDQRERNGRCGKRVIQIYMAAKREERQKKTQPICFVFLFLFKCGPRNRRWKTRRPAGTAAAGRGPATRRRCRRSTTIRRPDAILLNNSNNNNNRISMGVDNIVSKLDGRRWNLGPNGNDRIFSIDIDLPLRSYGREWVFFFIFFL